MNKRPPAITIIGWLFICVGGIGVVVGFVRMVGEVGSPGISGINGHSLMDFAFVAVSGLLAFVGGFYTLRGVNWGRGVLVVWMGLHVIISWGHTPLELFIHCVLFAGISYFLFRATSSVYFRKQ